MRAPALACGFAVALLLVAAPSTSAFKSTPPDDSPHDAITEAGAEAAGFPPEAIEALQRAVTASDFDDFEWDPQVDEPKRIDSDGSFRPEHHCDRIPPAGHVESFNATVAYVRTELDAAGATSRAGDPTEAVRGLGRALHAAQDCSSHSNAVDLAGADATFPQAILGNGSPPAGLMLTGFKPGVDDPEHPRDDPYPHGRFSKDSADVNAEAKLRLPDNRTKYEAARGMAEGTTRLLVERFLEQLGPQEVAALAEAEPAGGPAHDVDVPAVSPAVLAVVVGAAAVLAGRRR